MPDRRELAVGRPTRRPRAAAPAPGWPGTSVSAPMSAPVASSTMRKWWVSSTCGTLTLRSIRSWSHDAATVPVQNARPHSGSYSLRSWRGSSPIGNAAIHGGQPLGRGRAHGVPRADRPLVAEVRAPQVEHRTDRLADAGPGRRLHLRREQRRVLVAGGDDLTGLGVGRQPRTRARRPRRARSRSSAGR